MIGEHACGFVSEGPVMSDSFARSTRGARDARDWGLTRRAWFKASGFDDVDLAKPVIGIAQTWSELNHCHLHFRELAEAVKRGVWQAGGWPLEFPTISLGEFHISPTTMLYRNLMAMDTEEMIRAQPLDGVVLLASCDKTIPAQLMGAASRRRAGDHAHRRPDAHRPLERPDARRLHRLPAADRGAARRHDHAGAVSRDRGRARPLDRPLHGHGHRLHDGRAGRGAGMALPGTAAIPAPDSRRLRLAEAVGRQIVATGPRRA